MYVLAISFNLHKQFFERTIKIKLAKFKKIFFATGTAHIYQ